MLASPTYCAQIGGSEPTFPIPDLWSAERRIRPLADWQDECEIEYSVSRPKRASLVIVIGVSSVVIMTGDVERCVEFYRALGVPREHEDHGDGKLHAAADIGGVHFAVVPATGSGRSPGYRESGSTFVGFWVPSLEEAGTVLVTLGADVVLEHEVCEWGCRLVVADPDGRPIEVNQHAHCAAASADRPR